MENALKQIMHHHVTKIDDKSYNGPNAKNISFFLLFFGSFVRGKKERKNEKAKNLI